MILGMRGHWGHSCILFVGLAEEGKDIVVFRFIIEYNSSLRDFYRPLGNNNNRSIFLYENF